jgi:PilZ domain-containing protein
LEGFTMWAAGALFALRFSSDMLLPLVTGMLLGAVSVIVLRFVTPRVRPRPAPPPPTPKETVTPDPFVHGSATEQRRSLRRGGNPVPILVRLPDETEPGWRGWVFDRSMGGLGFVVESEFEPGAILRVLPVNAPQSTPWIDILVKSCRPGEEGFELGCQFVKTPPWSVLLLFG